MALKAEEGQQVHRWPKMTGRRVEERRGGQYDLLEGGAIGWGNGHRRSECVKYRQCYPFLALGEAGRMLMEE